MNLLESILLGIIQGLTEFLPISSSGHLVLAQHFLGINVGGILLEVILHLGTLTAILFYYWKDLMKMMKKIFEGDVETKKYVLFLFLSTLPIGFVGLLYGDLIESFFIPSFVNASLLVNGLILAITFIILNQPVKKITLFIALLIGIVQILALMPGISRSGITISIALIIGIRHFEAAKYSFFLAIPVLLGAGILQINKIEMINDVSVINLIVSFIFSALVGYFIIDWLLNIISKGKFYYFSLYCISLSIISHILINYN